MSKEDLEEWRKKFEFIERRFLNQGFYHSTAAIVASIDPVDISPYPYCEFYISDCSKTIQLEIDIRNKKDIDNTVYKMNQLIEVASLMKEKLEEMRPYIKAVNEDRERRKNEKEKDN